MFLVTLNVLFSIFIISLLIYLSNLKERFPELAQIGWNKLTAGFTFLLLAGVTGTLSSLSLGSTIFSSVQVSYFLQIGFLVLGIGWIFWGLSKWLAFIQQKREEFQNRQNELDYIRHSLTESQKGNSLVEILDVFLKAAVSHFGNQEAAVWITNPASSELVLASFRGLSPNLAKSLEKLSAQEGIAKQVCSGEIYFTSQIKTGADSLINTLSAEGIQSLILLPVNIRQSRIGMLSLFSEQKFKFEPAAAALLTEALSHLGDRIEFLRLNRELRKKSETLNQSIAENRILSVISGYLSSDLGLEPILDRILWEGLKVINASVGHIFLLEGNQVEVRATLEPSMVRVRGALNEFPLINQAVVSRSVVAEGSHLLVPIFRAGKISGILWYENKEAGSTFSTREVEQAKTLAHQASLAIAHWQLQQSASQAAEKLTELSSKLELLQAKYDELSAKQPEPVSEIETLLASQVNDINNLLAGVLGNVELLQDRLESGQMPYNQNLVESLKSIENTTLDAAALLKKFSQREAVEIIPAEEPVKIEAEKEQAPPSKGLRILAIDDQKMILDLLESMLSTLGHKTEVAESGEEGLRKFGSDSFDLVITDLGMPDISGFEVSQKIKQLKPEIPIVLITGWGANFEEAQLKEAGVDYLLAKPFRLEQLVEVVEKVVQPKS
jgi:CheY-like chemotaxis protein